MKIIIIGASLSGKTTLIKYLKNETVNPVSEIDEELTRLNNGNFPADEKIKNKLTRDVIDNILNKNEIIFFTNTDYFSVEDLKEAKKKGFKIIQLDIDLDYLLLRNKLRMRKESYPDMSVWLPGMVEYQKKIREADLVDEVVDVNRPINQITNSLLEIIKKLS